MKRIFFQLFVVFITVIGFWACKEGAPYRTSLQARQIPIDSTLRQDDSVDAFIAPYRNRLNEVLDAPLAYAPWDLTKTEGDRNTPLGNLLADILLERANAVFQLRENKAVDLSVLNHGGMRSDISRGPVSERTAYQVMPFENGLVVIGVKGNTLMRMVDFLASATRPHAIAGMEIVLTPDGGVKSARVGGKAIDTARTYYVATSDYLIGGGDGMDFFADRVSLFNTDYTIRNAMVDYLREQDTLRARIDNRFIQLTEE